MIFIRKQHLKMSNLIFDGCLVLLCYCVQVSGKKMNNLNQHKKKVSGFTFVKFLSQSAFHFAEEFYISSGWEGYLFKVWQTINGLNGVFPKCFSEFNEVSDKNICHDSKRSQTCHLLCKRLA